MTHPLRSLANSDIVRSVILPIASRLNPGDITVSHHWTGDDLRIHSFRHRGYWFHGRRREADVLTMMQRLVAPGDHILDVGGHIGYFTMFFAHLVGPGGSVDVFEPGANNLPYLRRNTDALANVTLNTVAISSAPGTATLFMDDLSGQNNSLGSEYAGLAANASSAHITVKVSPVEVEVTTLDLFARASAPVDLIKIDIEGGELAALEGASALLERDHPALMVEVTDQGEMVTSVLTDAGYLLVCPDGQRVEGRTLPLNVFALHRDRHRKVLRGLGAT